MAGCWPKTGRLSGRGRSTPGHPRRWNSSARPAPTSRLPWRRRRCAATRCWRADPLRLHDCFDAVVTAEGRRAYQARPRTLSPPCLSGRIPAAACVVIEDSVSGILAGKGRRLPRDPDHHHLPAATLAAAANLHHLRKSGRSRPLTRGQSQSPNLPISHPPTNPQTPTPPALSA